MSEETIMQGKASWQLEKTDPKEAELLKESLRNVHDPELGYSVIDLGLIRDVVKEENRAVITMILTTPFCPYGGHMIEQVRMAATEALKTDVYVDLRFDPWDPEMMEEGADMDWGFL
ncbi:MAG TPA: metal-sulfur cluster assembly factor [Flexilinea sp.]|nr:metal-sulfur cluster assembly factor [Flexilinea sp.]HOW07911.1 metal-sulfur cluster assembly factor [Flexilinea sp.]